MAIIILMLIVTMIPSGNYNWESESEVEPQPLPSDYALCYFANSDNRDRLSLASTIFSILLLTVGFGSRVVRLHKTLSIDHLGKVRSKTSSLVREKLSRLYI